MTDIRQQLAVDDIRDQRQYHYHWMSVCHDVIGVILCHVISHLLVIG